MPAVRLNIIAVIVGMFAVTYISRALPLVALSRARMPWWLERWLAHVPVAVLASLAASSVFVADGRLAPVGENLYLLASLPTLVVAVRTRSLLLSVVTGMAAVTVLRILGG